MTQSLWDKKQTCPSLVPAENVNSSILQQYVTIFSQDFLSVTFSVPVL